MKTSYYGTVIDGALRLDKMVRLANHSRVEVTLVPLEENHCRWQEAIAALRELKVSNPIATGLPRPRREDLYDRR